MDRGQYAADQAVFIAKKGPLRKILRGPFYYDLYYFFTLEY